MSAAISLVLVGTACDEGPEVVDMHGIEVPVPEGWTAEHSADGPRQTVTLRPTPPVAFCQVVVIRDGRVFREDDAQALLGDGLATFGGAERRDAALETEHGTMQGFVLSNPAAQPSWGLRGREGPAEVEMYATPRNIRLLAAVIGSLRGAPDAERDEQRCREIVRTLE